VTPARDTATPEERAEALQAFGRYLLRERELRGLTLEDVARVTKLGAAVIESIESGDPQRMPARAYLFGYLRSYSSATGLDPDEVVLRFQEAAGPEFGGPARLASPAGPGWRRKRVLVAALVALLVAAALAVGLWRSGRGGGEIRGRRSPERAPYRPADAP
jgi:cytoskeletal protein RodZ